MTSVESVCQPLRRFRLSGTALAVLCKFETRSTPTQQRRSSAERRVVADQHAACPQKLFKSKQNQLGTTQNDLERSHKQVENKTTRREMDPTIRKEEMPRRSGFFFISGIIILRSGTQQAASYLRKSALHFAKFEFPAQTGELGAGSFNTRRLGHFVYS